MTRHERRGAMRWLAVAAAVSSLGCAQATGGRVRLRDSAWTAPLEASRRANPLANQTAAVAGGRKLFLERCASCHGAEGRGTRNAPDLTEDGVQSQSDGALFWKISGGHAKGGMPTFSFLPEVHRWQLVLHLRALRSSPERSSAER